MKVLTRERSVPLPAPAHDGHVAIERALWLRRSVREFSERSLRLPELAQLLWATQGLTGLEGRRTAPSAGASYPLEVHVLAGSVEGVAPGHYRYLSRRQALLERTAGDRREAVARAAQDQAWIARAAAILVLTAVPERTSFTHGERGARYVQQEAGAAAQNLQLQATAMGLASAVVGAFRDAEVARLLELPAWEVPVCILPVGWPAEKRGVPC
jgi:SagB-type dehydrogenase family enzyme